MDWTNEEKSLLLYLETCAVDHGGRVDGRKMNSDDHEIAKRMEAEGFIRFGRLLSAYIRQIAKHYHCTHWVVLSDSGWERAAVLRKERGLRNIMPEENRTESTR